MKGGREGKRKGVEDHMECGVPESCDLGPLQFLICTRERMLPASRGGYEAQVSSHVSKDRVNFKVREGYGHPIRVRLRVRRQQWKRCTEHLQKQGAPALPSAGPAPPPSASASRRKRPHLSWSQSPAR